MGLPQHRSKEIVLLRKKQYDAKLHIHKLELEIRQVMEDNPSHIGATERKSNLSRKLPTNPYSRKEFRHQKKRTKTTQNADGDDYLRGVNLSLLFQPLSQDGGETQQKAAPPAKPQLATVSSIDAADTLKGSSFASAIHQEPVRPERFVSIKRINLSKKFGDIHGDEGPYAPGFNPPTKF